MSETSLSPADVAVGVADIAGRTLADQLLVAVLQQEGGMLCVKDATSGRYLRVDEAMTRLLGRDAADIVGRLDSELFDGVVATALRAADHTALAQPAPLWSDHRFELDGQPHEFTVVRVAADGLLGSVWLDRSQARRREHQLRSALDQLEQQQRANGELRRDLADKAMHDAASGLYTRAHFEDQLRREADLSTREQREFALVLIALDAPTESVQALGEPARAQVLEAVGRLLRGGTRAMDASCRYDDNRFAVLLSGVGLATAHSRMEGLRRRCATQIVLLGGQELGFTVAMGVASFPHTAQSLEALVTACEQALTEAQRRGGNHVTLASISLSSSAVSRA
jgi:diguanylate cyclase (GGDEF)-like protein